MTAFVGARKIRGVSREQLPLTMLLLAALLAAGTICGYLFAGNCAAETGGELGRYFEGYFSLSSRNSLSAAAMLRTLLCYFRAPLFAFLLGFASIGVVLIPLLCAFEGFLFSFSLFCFAAGLGEDGFFLLLALFAVRLLIVPPCTLLLGGAAWEASCSLAALSFGRGKRTKAVAYGGCWPRFGVSCVCLCFGAALELWLVPQVLTRLLH